MMPLAVLMVLAGLRGLLGLTGVRGVAGLDGMEESGRLARSGLRGGGRMMGGSAWIVSSYLNATKLESSLNGTSTAGRDL